MRVSLDVVVMVLVLVSQLTECSRKHQRTQLGPMMMVFMFSFQTERIINGAVCKFASSVMVREVDTSVAEIRTGMGVAVFVQGHLEGNHVLAEKRNAQNEFVRVFLRGGHHLNTVLGRKNN